MSQLFDWLTTSINMQLLAETAAIGADVAAEPVVEDFFSIQGLLTLGMLVLLQAVLGFDNLLYISIESKRVPEDKQPMVRKLGIGLAIVFRIGLLFVVVNLVERLQEAFMQRRFTVHHCRRFWAQPDRAGGRSIHFVDRPERDLPSARDSRSRRNARRQVGQYRGQSSHSDRHHESGLFI